jgi:hypothetical protein
MPTLPLRPPPVRDSTVCHGWREKTSKT